METARRFIAGSPTRFGAYLALQCALMQRFEARGGTAEEFCLRLAPAFHRRYAPLLLEPDSPLPSGYERQGRGRKSPAPPAPETRAGDSLRPKIPVSEVSPRSGGG